MHAENDGAATEATASAAPPCRKLSDLQPHAQQQGFINYFGLQRFGTGSVPTHVVGRTLLKNEWGPAVEMILRSRLGDNIPPFPISTNAIQDLLKRVPRWMVLGGPSAVSLRRARVRVTHRTTQTPWMPCQMPWGSCE